MGMLAFYAGLIMGTLVGIVFMVLLSKVIRPGVPNLPQGREVYTQAPGGTVEL